MRCRYLITRQFKSSLPTPDGFLIESEHELISYWSFFVEREGWAKDWALALRNNSSPLVLDVGANAGVFTHWIWTQNQHAKFIIFEPLPAMASKIRNWISHAGANATLHQAAVSDRSGEAVFYTDADNDTGASLRSESSRTGKLTVPLVTLDSIVPTQAVLLTKIDVEGCELEVLRGAIETLRNTQFLLLEAHTQEALAAIKEILVESNWQCRRVGSSDFLFSRR